MIADSLKIGHSVLLAVYLILVADHLGHFIVIDECSWCRRVSSVGTVRVVAAVSLLCLGRRTLFLLLQLVSLTVFVANFKDFTNTLRDASI